MPLFVRQFPSACLLSLVFIGSVVPSVGAPSVIASYRLPGVPEEACEQDDESMSPDGRWLAIGVEAAKYTAKLQLLDLMSGKAHDVRLPSREWEIGSISWRSDSRLAAVATVSGTLLISPYRSDVKLIDKKQVSNPSWYFDRTLCCCWSPSGRLAIFRPYGDWVIWDGKTCRKMPNWETAIKAPTEACDDAWQCAWSSDERYLAFRFYGAHGERTYSSALHTYLFDAYSGKPLDWGVDAGPVAWDNGHSLFYRTGYGIIGPYPLMRASATKAPDKSWMKNSVAYTVSEDRKTVYSVTDAGDVYSSPTNQLKWHLLHRLNVKFSFDLNGDWLLAPMPHGFVACVGGDNGKVSRYTVTAWTDSGHVSRLNTTSVQLIGWSRARKAFVYESYDKGSAKVSLIR